MRKALKSVAIFLILGIILLTLTGCANVNYDIKLNKDGSADITYVMGYDKSFLTSIGVETSSLENDNSFDEMEEEAKQNGYNVEKYEDDSTYGFKASKHVDNIEEFNLEDEVSESNEETDKIVYEKTLLKTKYSQSSKIDLTDMGAEDEDAAMLKTLMTQMKVSYKITLPFKAGSNNANTVSEDGKTLEWVLKVGEVNEVKFEAAQDYGMYALAILALVLVVVATVTVILSKKAKKTEKAKSTETIKEEVKPVEEVKSDEKIENVEVEEAKVEVQEVDKKDIEAVNEENVQELTKEAKDETVEEIPTEEETTNIEEVVEENAKESKETAAEDENKKE